MNEPNLDIPGNGAASEAAHAQDAQGEDQEISLLDLAIVLAQNKRLILGLPAIVGMVAIFVSLLLPNIYTGTAKLMPPQQGQSSAMALLSQAGGGALAGLAGGALGIKNPSDLYVGMLKSRTVADRLIERFKLKELYDTATQVDTRRELESKVSIVAGKDGILTVNVEDKDPRRAADMANAYVEELDRLVQTLAVTEAAQRRLFFEKQLQQAREALVHAEVGMQKTQERTGLIKLEDQGRAIIDSVARLKADITVRELQLSAMRAYTTDQHPDYRRLQNEISGMKAQVSRTEQGEANGNGDILVPTSKVPKVGLEYVRSLRNVKYYESMYELLAKQYEIARIDEAKDAVIIQVVDKAVPPDRKSKPKRAVIVLVSAMLALLAAVVLVFVRESFSKAAKNPEHAERLSLLKRLAFKF